MDDLVALGRYGASSAFVTRDGEILPRATNILLLFRPAWQDHPVLARPDVRVFDLAELWAFVRPGRAVPPTLQGMTGQTARSAEDAAFHLYELMDDLLREAAENKHSIAPYLAWLADPNSAWRWPWMDALEALQDSGPPIDLQTVTQGIERWTQPRDWTAHDTIRELNLRPQQDVYHQAVRQFLIQADTSQTLLAVGGTGVGKTRAYLAASREAVPEGQIWVSTFTKALQQQVRREADTTLGLPAHIRKGRDNYLCLKLMQEAWQRAPTLADGRQRLALLIMLRWLDTTGDGDLTGASFPGWLTSLFGPMITRNLADLNRECIYNACPFYTQCYAEAARAYSEDAPLVIANHAIIAGMAPRFVPRTLILDEAQHVESVMDEALSMGLSLQSAADMRRFLLGMTGTAGRRTRRGFLDTIAEALPSEEAPLLQKARQAAEILPSPLYLERFQANVPQGPIEGWLHQLGQIVLTTVSDDTKKTQFDWEMNRSFSASAPPELIERLLGLKDIVSQIVVRLNNIVQETSEQKGAIDPKAAVLESMAILKLQGWITQLGQLGQTLPNDFIEWAAIRREDGRVRDVGLYRAWRKPMDAWAQLAKASDARVVLTTATASPGLTHMHNIHKIQVDSPFDYTKQSKVLIVTDGGDAPAQVAESVARLTTISGGGALAVFTAITRLKTTYQKLLPLCDRDNLNLLSQHKDALDVSTLIDMFRSEPRSLLLGTDAVRDGIDIPGEALRLLIFDRVPWPRPTLVHKERREAFGGRAYDEDLVKLKLKQAFGRLIRTSEDRGVFVLLDGRMPSRLYGAFPEGAPIERVTLAEACVQLSDFFQNPGA